MKNIIWLFLVALTLACCSVPSRTAQTELYFGLSQKNGPMISDSAWNAFVSTEVSKVFADGFTIIRSEGKWADRLSRDLHSEPSGIITSVGIMTTARSKRIDSLREKYKALFLQESVLRVDKKVSASF